MMKEEPNVFLEVLEEYILGGLITLNQQDVLSLFETIISENKLEHKNRL